MGYKKRQIRPQWIAKSGLSITKTAIIDPISTVSVLISILNNRNSELP